MTELVEGARLESVCRGNSTEGSNPSLSAINYRKKIKQIKKIIALIVLDGEAAVPCNPQSAIAGLNSCSRINFVRSGFGKW
jgi:hypothetical protein